MQFFRDLEKSDKIIIGTSAALALLLMGALVYDILYFNSDVQGLKQLGKVTSAKNHVKRRQNQSLIWNDINGGEPIYDMDWVYTGANSQTDISLFGGGEVQVQPETLVIISFRDGKINLDLQYGQVLGNLDPNKYWMSLLGKKLDMSKNECSPNALKGKGNAKIIDCYKKGKLSFLNACLLYKPDEGYSNVDELGLSYRLDNDKSYELYRGEKGMMDFKWVDVFDKWEEFELRMSEDPKFKQVASQGKVQESYYQDSFGQPALFHWQVRCFDKKNKPSQWSAKMQANLNIDWKSKATPLTLLKKDITYLLRWKDLKNIKKDNTVKITSPVALKWPREQKADKYHIQTSRNKSFSKIIMDKHVKSLGANVDRLNLGKTYFRLTPRTSEGAAVAEPSNGVIRTWYPAPRKRSLVTVDNFHHKTIQWEEIPSVEMYKITYDSPKTEDKEKDVYVKSNVHNLYDDSNSLNWTVVAVDPKTKKVIGNKSAKTKWKKVVKELTFEPPPKREVAVVKPKPKLPKPKITSPPSGKTFYTSVGAEAFVVMRWEYELDPAHYEVQISTEPDMKPVLYTEKSEKKVLFYTKKLKPGIYFMRVRPVHDDKDEKDRWSLPRVFRVLNY